MRGYPRRLRAAARLPPSAEGALDIRRPGVARQSAEAFRRLMRTSAFGTAAGRAARPRRGPRREATDDAGWIAAHGSRISASASRASFHFVSSSRVHRRDVSGSGAPARIARTAPQLAHILRRRPCRRHRRFGRPGGVDASTRRRPPHSGRSCNTFTRPSPAQCNCASAPRWTRDRRPQAETGDRAVTKVGPLMPDENSLPDAAPDVPVRTRRTRP